MNKKDKEIQNLKNEIIGHKQIIEQLELARDKAEMFIDDNYPLIKEFEVSEGWYNHDGTSTYRVKINVFAEDLHKLIRFFTSKSLREKKYQIIRDDFEKEFKEEYNIRD